MEVCNATTERNCHLIHAEHENSRSRTECMDFTLKSYCMLEFDEIIFVRWCCGLSRPLDAFRKTCNTNVAIKYIQVLQDPTTVQEFQ